LKKKEKKRRSTTGKAKNAGAKRGRPIAAKLLRKTDKYVHGKVIDLEAIRAGRANAEELQKTVATRGELAGFHPADAAYVYTQLRPKSLGILGPHFTLWVAVT